ncbi:hypothetical protein HZB02_01570 [Candidatus Woesearchaeota archaeon]|nr:hypothetical protein [Candidatus Woesearchaeota archaeon]
MAHNGNGHNGNGHGNGQKTEEQKQKEELAAENAKAEDEKAFQKAAQARANIPTISGKHGKQDRVVGYDRKEDHAEHDHATPEHKHYRTPATVRDKQLQNLETALADQKAAMGQDAHAENPVWFGKLKEGVTRFYDNTIGSFMKYGQNRQTMKELQKDPSKPIAYLLNSHYHLAAELKKKGYHVFHLKDMDGDVERIYEQISKIHQRAGLHDPKKRNDIISGYHTRTVPYIASHAKVKDYGITLAQARDTPLHATTEEEKAKTVEMYGEQPKTVGEMHQRQKPYIKLQVVAGQHTHHPQDTVHGGAHNYRIEHAHHLDGKEDGVNTALLELLNIKDPRYAKKLPKNVTYMKDFYGPKESGKQPYDGNYAHAKAA